MVDISDVNDPNRIWDIPEDWKKFGLNWEYWDHTEVMTPRGRMIVVTQKPGKNNKHHPYQFCTSVNLSMNTLNFYNSAKPLTASDVRPWEFIGDGFSEDQIEKAMEFIQKG